MQGEKLTRWVSQKKNKKILNSFSIPKTPTEVKNELCIGKFNLKPHLKRGLIKCLNPKGYKGRLYVLTKKARRLLKLPAWMKGHKINYDLIGWILASPKQRYVVLKTLAMNSIRLTSEDIRFKSSNLNPCLSRISTKNILKELINKGLAETEMGNNLKRYYWINEDGKLFASELH
jgi:predicted transcriptional regulator